MDAVNSAMLGRQRVIFGGIPASLKRILVDLFGLCKSEQPYRPSCIRRLMYRQARATGPLRSPTTKTALQRSLAHRSANTYGADRRNRVDIAPTKYSRLVCRQTTVLSDRRRLTACGRDSMTNARRSATTTTTRSKVVRRPSQLHLFRRRIVHLLSART